MKEWRELVMLPTWEKFKYKEEIKPTEVEFG